MNMYLSYTLRNVYSVCLSCAVPIHVGIRAHKYTLSLRYLRVVTRPRTVITLLTVYAELYTT